MNEDLDMPASEEQNQGESAENSGTELSAMESIILERDDFRDQLLRKSAEFENYRRRTMKEKQDLIDFANEHLILKMLPFVDDLHTALEAAKQSTDPEGFLKGVEMIYAKAIKIFEEAGVSPIEIAPGDPFNVEVHEALAHMPSHDAPEGHILHEIQRGYTLREKVIRHTKVVTSAGSPD
ncbi:MAG: nucleotide exchange factor GrpE [Ignavibacteria bacterium]|nr:nucleotide exchange factor GrpE [Ignavibacteria bacterium]